MSQRTLKRMKWTNRKAREKKMGRKIPRQAKSDEQKSRRKMKEWKNNNSSSRKIHGISIKLGYMHVKEIYMFFFLLLVVFRSRLFASVLYLMRACNVLTQRHSAAVGMVVCARRTYGVVVDESHRVDCHKGRKTKMWKTRQTGLQKESTECCLKCGEMAERNVTRYISRWLNGTVIVQTSLESLDQKLKLQTFIAPWTRLRNARDEKAHGNENVRNRKVDTCAPPLDIHTAHTEMWEQTMGDRNELENGKKKMKSLSRKITLSYHIVYFSLLSLLTAPCVARALQTMIAVLPARYTVCILMQQHFPSSLSDSANIALLFCMKKTKKKGKHNKIFVAIVKKRRKYALNGYVCFVLVAFFPFVPLSVMTRSQFLRNESAKADNPDWREGMKRNNGMKINIFSCRLLRLSSTTCSAFYAVIERTRLFLCRISQ